TNQRQQTGGSHKCHVPIWSNKLHLRCKLSIKLSMAFETVANDYRRKQGEHSFGLKGGGEGEGKPRMQTNANKVKAIVLKLICSGPGDGKKGAQTNLTADGN
ncbi:hypothetical protein BaRGS_00037881, partial [Batillaria attramentaria]